MGGGEAELWRWPQQLEGTSCMREKGMGGDLGDTDLAADLPAENKGALLLWRGSGRQTDRQTEGWSNQPRKNLPLAAPSSF